MNPIQFLRGPWTIAIFTLREGIRRKTVITFLILSLLVIFGANFMTSFLDPTSDTDIDLKLIKDICVSAISIFGVLITIFISASAVPSEVENKTIYTVLSKPVRRIQYLLGKFVGVQLVILINLLLMGGLFFMALYFRQDVMPTLLLWSLLLTYFEFLIVSAFTFAVSCTATSAVLPTIGGLFIYFTGHLVEYLYDVYNRAGQTEELFDTLIGYAAFALWNILPNLQRFSLKNDIVESAPNAAPPVDAMIPQLLLYGSIYTFAGFILAYWIFRRKEV